MKLRKVFIEIGGEFHLVGSIAGQNAEEASFSYDEQYLSEAGCRPISISLPLQEEPFSAKLTKSFFDRRVSIKKRIKETWLYIVYSLCDKRPICEIISHSGQQILTMSQFPVGFFLYLYWKHKYL